MSKLNVLVLVLIAFVMTAGVSIADEITMYPVELVNPGFETPVVTGHTQIAVVEGWVKGARPHDGITDWYTAVEPGGTEGAQSLYIASDGANLIQKISGLAQPGATYTLTLDAKSNHYPDSLALVMVVENDSVYYTADVDLTVGEWVTGSVKCTLPETVVPNSGFVIGVGGYNMAAWWECDILIDNAVLTSSYEMPANDNNLSFEVPGVAAFTTLKENGVENQALPGWDMSSANVTYVAVQPGGTDGAQGLYLNSAGADLLTNFPTMAYPDTTYVLQVDAKGNEDTDRMGLVVVVGGAMSSTGVDLLNGTWSTGRLYATADSTVTPASGITVGIGGENTDIEIDNVRFDAVMQNMSFEFPSVTGWTNIVASDLAGWEASTMTAAALYHGGTDGSQALYLNSNGANLIQKIMLEGQPGKTYTLQVDGKGNEVGDSLVLVLVIENSTEMGTLEVPVTTTE